MDNLIHIPEYFDDLVSPYLYDAALNMGLKQYPITIFDKVLMQPRLTAWCSDDGKGYAYSKQVTPVVEWPEIFLQCRKRLEREFELELPTCLVNMYRDGKDSVGWHRDDESIFGLKPAIISISLGGTRRFKMRNKQTKEVKNFELANGDLLYFSGKYTNGWEHCVPKTAKEVNPRISLTYRTIK
jgi:alkylated DNA repair dioxygenase AlkB